MIPKGAEGVRHLATRAVTDLIPKAADAYMAADIGLMASLIDMVAQDYDRAVDVLIADQNDIREIFQTALASVEDTALTARMSAIISARAASFRVSDQTVQADAAMRVLIDLHAHVEDAEPRGDPWAAPLNLRIWSFLDAHVARHAYESAF